MSDVVLGEPELELAKKIAHEVWEKYDDEFGYRTEKQLYSDAVPTDHPDNIWSFWGQFDIHNQREFTSKVVTSGSGDVGEKLLAWCMVELKREEEAWDKIEKDFGFRL